MKKYNILAGLAMIALSLSALPSFGAGQLYEKKVVVSYSDLDLSHPAGARTLYARIQSAARRACSPEEFGIYSLKQNYRACVTTAVRTAVDKVNQPTLTALLRAKYSGAG